MLNALVEATDLRRSTYEMMGLFFTFVAVRE